MIITTKPPGVLCMFQIISQILNAVSDDILEVTSTNYKALKSQDQAHTGNHVV